MLTYKCLWMEKIQQYEEEQAGWLVRFTLKYVAIPFHCTQTNRRLNGRHCWSVKPIRVVRFGLI